MKPIILTLVLGLLLSSCTIGVTNVERLTVVPDTSASPIPTGVPQAPPTVTPSPYVPILPTGVPTSANVELVGQVLRDAATIFVQDNLAYVGGGRYASGNDLSTIIDVSDQAHPLLVSQTNRDTDIVKVAGDYAYSIGLGKGDCEGFDSGCLGILEILDVSDPSTPARVGTYTWSRPPQMNWAIRIAPVGHAVYIADSAIGLLVLDVSNPSAPVEVSRQEGSAWDVATMGDHAYVVYTSDVRRTYYHVLDISNPTVPVEVGSYNITDYGPVDVPSVKVANGYAYFAVERGSLDIVDVSNPLGPHKVGSYRIPEKDSMSVGYISDFVVVDDHAYVDSVYGSDHVLRVVDISDPAFPSDVGFYEFQGGIWDLAVVDATIYVACVKSAHTGVTDEGGIFILRYTGPES